MVTFKTRDFNYNPNGSKNRVEGECLSTDTKPTTDIANGSILIEMDTGDIYMFNETAGAWVKVA